MSAPATPQSGGVVATAGSDTAAVPRAGCPFRFTDGLPCSLYAHAGDRHRVRPPDEGWAAGSLDGGGAYLTVWGSHWAPGEGGRIYATRDAAEARAARLRARSVPTTAAGVVVRRVRGDDGIFRLLDEPDPHAEMTTGRA